MHPSKFMGRPAKSVAPQLSAAEREDRLAALGSVIAEKRKDAVDARKTSGIEAMWMTCEESYLGIDDWNRHEFSGAKWCKPTSMSGPVTASRAPAREDARSTAFVRLSSRYADNATAKLCEILLPIDDKAFSFKPTPDPDLIKQLDDQSPALDANGNGMVKPAAPAPASGGAAPAAAAPAPAQLPGLPPVPATPPAPGGAPAAPATPAATPQPVTKADVAKAVTEAAQDAAGLAEKRIFDWMLESKYPAEARNVVADSARIGVGVLKGPFPDLRTSRAIIKNDSGKGVTVKMERKVAPALRWVDPWNIFPDDACGECIHDGDYLLERDFLSKKQLKRLASMDGYLQDQVELVLEEGPGKEYESGGNPNDKNKDRKRFEIWYFYGMVKRADMDLAAAPGIEDMPDDQEEVPAILFLVNDRIIRAVINPLDSGAFPYHPFSWSRRPGHWAGVGVVEQGSMPQRVCNAALRGLLNNAGLSSGVQVVIDRKGITPANGDWALTPNKIWYMTEDAADASKAFAVSEIPNVGPALEAILTLGEREFEQATGIPLVTQGAKGPNTPQTFGQAELQDNNSLTWLRSVGVRYDDQVTEPAVDQFYEWLLLDPDVPDEEKGDFQCDAQGSSAMVERAIQEQVLLGLLQAAANPAFNVDPSKLFAEYLKSKRLDPRKIQLSEEEIAQRAAQPPAAPIQIQVEQAKGNVAMQLEAAKVQGQLQLSQNEMTHEQNLLTTGGATPHAAAAMAKVEATRIQAQTSQSIQESRSQAELARAQTEQQIAQQNGQLDLHKMQLQKDMAILQYANQQKLSLQQVQADLAQTAITERTKRDLGAAEIQLAASEGGQNRAIDVQKHATSLVRDQMSTPVTP